MHHVNRSSEHYWRILQELAAMLRIREPKDDGFIDHDDIKPHIQNIREAADRLEAERAALKAVGVTPTPETKCKPNKNMN